MQLSAHQVAQIQALKNEQNLTFTIDNTHILALKLDNQCYFYENLCPHLNKRLANDSMHCFDDSFCLIECQFHSAQFNPASGACVSGPCLGESLKAYKLTEQQGLFYLLTTSF
ncbi:Rieske [2Fe-2S] domain protein [Marinomonas aquimarina]|uniref:Rieske [2Fe-2S] domain protein n=1 Tax=Marinomonas aquimarina TaxID=295068 RepID=A0A1A8TP85_9GAMM|nr:Rieske 2Fe-2S domain-containing protein [Marinomonas aquimarina]SBS35103.1 Rieske [2Fe-2S] domain protein [Marinomonas aquimarina]